jgi:TIR domain
MSGSNELSQSFQPHRQAVEALHPLPQMEPIHIHICYANQDADLKERLRNFLSALDKDLVKLWDRDDIRGGGNIPAEIKSSLARSSVILILLSSHLKLESDGEYQQAIDRYHAGDVELVPLWVLPWVLPHDLRGLRSFPKDGRPILSRSMPEQDQALLEITEEVRVICEGIQDSNRWDRQIEEDILGGRLEALATMAIAEHRADNSRPFPEES